ncbi:hypothetical protein JCM19233_5948 [Vibrio astriarenae]|nr:hypothetical protein JCM19233_5948 [Vibrio sp. C7]
MLDSYVRQRGDLSLLQAIDKMSYKPATILQDYVPQMKKKVEFKKEWMQILSSLTSILLRTEQVIKIQH